METDDLHLDAEQPFVNVRPSTTKNHKQAVIALHPDVVVELRKLPLLPGKVFANRLKIEPSSAIFAAPGLNSSTPRAGGRIFIRCVTRSEPTSPWLARRRASPWKRCVTATSG
jgi:hypothetical protein